MFAFGFGVGMLCWRLIFPHQHPQLLPHSLRAGPGPGPGGALIKHEGWDGQGCWGLGKGITCTLRKISAERLDIWAVSRDFTPCKGHPTRFTCNLLGVPP